MKNTPLARLYAPVKNFTLLICSLVLFHACKNTSSNTERISISPAAGSTFHVGETVKLKVSGVAADQADSVLYFADSIKIASKRDTATEWLHTDSLMLGLRLITAKVYFKGKIKEASTYVVLLATEPEFCTYHIKKVYPHDTSSYTEGLAYENGKLFESGGGYGDQEGPSSLSEFDLTSEKTIQKIKLKPDIFAEGIAINGNNIIQLTWKEHVAFVYDKNSLRLLRTFQNTVSKEGWGLCSDGNKLYMDDGSNRIWILNKDFKKLSFIDVYDNKDSVSNLNELEYVDGKIYANIWQSNKIVIINPKNGAVERFTDLTMLYEKRNAEADVLNGIAWDAKGHRLFVTGKKWAKLFQIEVIGVPNPI